MTNPNNTNNSSNRIMSASSKNNVSSNKQSDCLGVGILGNGKCIALFDTKLPDKLRMTRTEPFKQRIDDFTVELNATATRVIVYRYNKLFYDIVGNINKVCFSKNYLVVYTAYIQIYALSTGCLLFPFISYRLVFLDLLNDLLLLVNTYGDFIVLNLKTQQSWDGHLSKTKNLLRIELNSTYFILAEYPTEILFYSPQLKTWFCLNPQMNTIATQRTDWESDKDETLAELDNHYRVAKFTNESANKKIIVRRIVAYFCRVQQMNSQQEYFLEEIIVGVSEKNEIIYLLEQLNTVVPFQEFVDRMYEKLVK